MAGQPTQDEVENLAESMAMRMAMARDFLRLVPQPGSVPLDADRRDQIVFAAGAVQASLKLLGDALKQLDGITPALKL